MEYIPNTAFTDNRNNNALGHASHQRNGRTKFSNVDKSLVEAWACYTGWYMTNIYYSTTINKAPNPPVYTWQYWYKGTPDNPRYNPVLIDLTDDFNQNVMYGSKYPRDNVKGFPAWEVEKIAFDSHNFGQLRGNANKYVGRYFTQKDLDNLFDDICWN